MTDQFTSPTYVPNMSHMLIEIAKRQFVGIIHLAGANRISRYEMAKLIADKLQLNKKLLKTASMDDIKWFAKRPRDSSLDVSKASSILNEKPYSLESSLDDFVKEMKLKKMDC